MRWQPTILFIVLMTTAACLAYAGDPGQDGALSLRIGVGARASAMGEAQTAVAEDASTVFWNPGAMAAVQGTNVILSHIEYFQTIHFEQAAVTHETAWGTLGLMFSGMFMSDLERRDNVPTAVPLGTFGVYDVSFAVAFSRYIVPNVAVGISVKPVYERIDEMSASGFAFDAGIYHVSRVRGLKLAAVVGNIGAPMKFDAEQFALPRYVKVGGSWEREVPAIEGRVLLAVDGMFPNDDGARLLVGGEYSYRRMLSLRVGYKGGYDLQGPTFGLGVRHHEMSLDYAFLPTKNEVGDNHRFGLGFSF